MQGKSKLVKGGGGGEASWSGEEDIIISGFYYKVSRSMTCYYAIFGNISIIFNI